MKSSLMMLYFQLRSIPRRRAFTLIELVVVLALVGILTHLLVNEFSRFHARSMRAAADSHLAAIRAAVAGDPDARDSTGARIREGFIADMGRAPRAIRIDSDDPTSPLSLRELWERPADADDFAMRPATAANLVAGCESAVDPYVYVPCGWRGPYIRLPLNQTRLRDPWGNPVETPDSAGTARLFGASTNASDAISEGEAIAWVRHLGADGRDDSLDPVGADRSADDADRWCRIDSDPDEPRETRLLVTARVLDANGCADAASLGRTVTGILYSPCGSAITAAVETASVPAGASVNLRFGSLTPGTRVLRVRLDGIAASDDGAAVVPPLLGVVHSLRLQPGDNSFVETFRTDSQVAAP